MSAPALGGVSCALFDLDNTLFDHRYSLRNGIAALQGAYSDALSAHDLDALAVAHNRALEQAYRTGMRAGVPAAEVPALRTMLFLRSLGLEGELEPRALAAVYEEAYLADRRATAGSIELLARLKDAGWRVAIVSDGARRTQQEKAIAIDVWPLIDAMVTSEDAGVTKPDERLFAIAAQACEAPLNSAVMIGDDLDRDVVGALEAGAAAIHYAPGADTGDPSRGGAAPAIGHMHEAMALLGVAPVAFGDPDAVESRIVGWDMVITARHCSAFSRQDAVELWAHTVGALQAVVCAQWALALPQLASALAIIVRCARILDAAKVEIVLPELPADVPVLPPVGPHGTSEFRRFTARFMCGPLAETNAVATAVVEEVQAGLTSASRDHPRAAARSFRRAVLLTAEQLDVRDKVQITGEGIER